MSISAGFTAGLSQLPRTLCTMRAILSALMQLLKFRFRSRAPLELEVVALRHQLKVLKRRSRPRSRHRKFKAGDRIFWVWLFRILPKCVNFISLVKPVTLIRWHNQGFKLYWSWRSRRKTNGHGLSTEIRELILRMHRDNPLWGSGRIHGKLLKLGFKISEFTVRKYLPTQPKFPSPSWKVFFRNYLDAIAAADSFVVVTTTYRLICGFVVLGLGRRRIMHFGVTDHPTQEWILEQIREAFRGRPNLRYLLRDGDAVYGNLFLKQLKNMGIKQVVTASKCPWHNNHIESLIGTIRRECLNHVIVFNERHLNRILSSYVNYYNETRTHKALDKGSPNSRVVQLPSAGKKIIAIPNVGGLHHRYERRAA
jgi:transposase InsO family protein